jgi:hypothetical protein
MDDGPSLSAHITPPIKAVYRADQPTQPMPVRYDKYVSQVEVEKAIDGWEEWATVIDTMTYRLLSLARIRSRIHAAGLD